MHLKGTEPFINIHESSLKNAGSFPVMQRISLGIYPLLRHFVPQAIGGLTPRHRKTDDIIGVNSSDFREIPALRSCCFNRLFIKLRDYKLMPLISIIGK